LRLDFEDQIQKFFYHHVSFQNEHISLLFEDEQIEEENNDTIIMEENNGMEEQESINSINVIESESNEIEEELPQTIKIHIRLLETRQQKKDLIIHKHGRKLNHFFKKTDIRL
jgi:hypothetical protein